MLLYTLCATDVCVAAITKNIFKAIKYEHVRLMLVIIFQMEASQASQASQASLEEQVKQLKSENAELQIKVDELKAIAASLESSNNVTESALVVARRINENLAAALNALQDSMNDLSVAKKLYEYWMRQIDFQGHHPDRRVPKWAKEIMTPTKAQKDIFVEHSTYLNARHRGVPEEEAIEEAKRKRQNYEDYDDPRDFFGWYRLYPDYYRPLPAVILNPYGDGPAASGK